MHRPACEHLHALLAIGPRWRRLRLACAQPKFRAYRGQCRNDTQSRNMTVLHSPFSFEKTFPLSDISCSPFTRNNQGITAQVV
jgi:hypothetical protein